MIRRARLEGSSFLRGTLAFSALASIAACGAEAPEWVSGDADESRVAAAPESLARNGMRSSKQMPVELRAAYIRTVQIEAPASYAAARIRPDAIHLQNVSQSFVGTLDRQGLELKPNEASWSFSLRTNAVGCENEAVSLAEPQIEVEGNRVRYARPGLEEWYLNGPLGVEQGFVVDEAPACKGPKVIQMQTGGDLRAVLGDANADGQGESIRFVRPDGETSVTMAHLYVHDAEGKNVPAWFTAESGNIAIHVDDTGATYPLDIDPLIAVLEIKLDTEPATSTNDQFGYGLAFSGNTAIIGAPKSDEFGTDSGSAYVFVRQSPGVWVQQGPKLLPVDGRPGQWFGFSIGFSGDTAVITAPYDNDGGVAAGAAYVFVRNSGVWSQQAKLRATDNKAGDIFGVSGAINGDRIVIGANGVDFTVFPSAGNEGAAYVFNRTGGIWTQAQKIAAGDGAPMDLFGTTVTVSPDTIGVASVYDDDLGAESGSMYMFGLNGGSWVQQQKLLAPGGAAGDFFGYWAAISNDTMVASAALYDDGVPNSDFGAAFVYIKSGSTWTLQQKLIAPDRKSGDWFGSHVAVDGNSVVVGAQQTDEFGTDSGSAYWFIRNAGVWNLRDKLLPQPGAAGDRFGWTVAVSGGLVAVGAPFDDTRATDAGAVYVFTEKKTNGEPCTNGTECVSGICVDGVCCDTVCGGGNPNDCQACSAATGGPVDGTCSPIAAGVTCRNSVGACDVADKCDGIATECPPDRKVGAGTECRAAVDLCDIAEKCDGMTNNCPPDGAAPAGTECRASVGGCDIAEKCTGFAPSCPPDTKVSAGTTCRAAAGPCDTAEVCDGMAGVCPTDTKVTGGVECRASAGACDSPEVCDGTTDGCPADQKVPNGTECRASVGACDNAEACNGVSNDCPVDTKVSVGTVCRASSGICDQPEACDGVSDNCPADGKSPSGVICRAAAGICDVPETCNGIDGACPADGKSATGTVCRASGGLCDVAEACDGKTNDCPGDGKVGAGQVCRLSKGLCDEVEVCDGKTNACPADKKTGAGIFCRAPAGICDEAEACDGVNDTCPTDKLTDSGILCRAAAGICDIAEACTGKSPQCPPDKLVAPGTECRDAQGTCDIAESCDGTNPDCPQDIKVSAGIPCHPSSGECDALETCDGKGNDCPPDVLEPDGTVCSVGSCEKGECIPPTPPPVVDYALYGGGPLCQTGPVGSSTSNWPFGLAAIALGTLRRRSRSSKH